MEDEQLKFKTLKYKNQYAKNTNNENNYTWDEIVGLFKKEPSVNAPIDETDKGIDNAKYKNGLYLFGKSQDLEGEPNKRGKNYIQYRSILSLDYDDINGSFDEVIEKLASEIDKALDNSTYLIHTTYKSIKKKPRFRVLIPLTETVTPSEYKSCVNYIASQIDFEIDEFSNQAERFMCAPNKKAKNSHYYCGVYNNNNIFETNILLQCAEIWEKENKQIVNKSFHKVKPASYWSSISMGVIDGGRTNALTSIIGKLAYIGIERDLAFGLAYGWNQLNDPPLENEVVIKTFDSIWAKHFNKGGVI